MLTYMTGQYVLQTEHNDEFLRISIDLDTLMDETFETGCLDRYRQLSQKSEAKTLTPYIMPDLNIYKLYLAAHTSDWVKFAFHKGVPINITETLKKETFEKISHASGYRQLSSIIEQMIQSLISAYRHYNVNQYSYKIRRAIEFIHHEQYHNISARDVSQYLNMERTGLSRRFHQEVGYTITDYIHHTKMNTAEKFISERKYSLQEISDLLGYNSLSYFCRIYKKYKGHSPASTSPTVPPSPGKVHATPHTCKPDE